ncbi:EGF-like domain protein [Trichuris suis]|nr:EGF-like domain protein [Trichuris suis]
MPGFSGHSCEFKRFLCTRMSCNHGNCTQRPLDYSCTCEVGYTGKTCNEEIDECLTENCENGGTCQDEVNGISCKCPEEWTGGRCEEVFFVKHTCGYN